MIVIRECCQGQLGIGCSRVCDAQILESQVLEPAVLDHPHLRENAQASRYEIDFDDSF